jgi:hypothetical protein
MQEMDNTKISKLYHPLVDYSLLNEREYKLKRFRDLYTIFYLSRNVGLTDMEIHEWIIKLGILGYNSLTPDSVVRGNIYRWNDLSNEFNNISGRCNDKTCKKYSNHGYEIDKPLFCRRHAEKSMILVVEERLYLKKNEYITNDDFDRGRKNKFFLDPRFFQRMYLKNMEYWKIPLIPLIPEITIKKESLENNDFDDFLLDENEFSKLEGEGGFLFLLQSLATNEDYEVFNY